MDSDFFRTNVGLTYFRQVKDGKHLTDEQLLELHQQIRTIEDAAFKPQVEAAFMRSASWATPAVAPFDLIPCHRHIMLEVQGEEWVFARECEAGMREIQRIANADRDRAAVEEFRRQQAALAKQLRDL